MRTSHPLILSPRLLGLVALLAAAGLILGTLSGCGDESSSASDIITIESDAEDGGVDIFAPDVPRDTGSDGVTEDTASPDVGADAEDSVDEVEDSGPTLPLCTRACDAVVDCGVELCEGIDWQTAGLAYKLCADACDDTFAEAVLDATETGCDDVATIVVDAVPDLEALCSSELCQLACDRIAECAVAECSLLDEPARDMLFDSCFSGCQPSGELGGLLNLTCPQLIDLLDNDPGFAAACEPSACPPPPMCAGFAEKSTSCILANCNGNADPYQQGIRELLTTYCTSDPECPSASDLEALLEPALTCTDQPFIAFGPSPPFTTVCEGSVGVDHDALVSACQGLVVCNFEVGTIELCALSLAIQEDPVTLEACLSTATDCTQAGACFAGQ